MQGATLERQADAALKARDLAGAERSLVQACAAPDASADRWIKLASVRRARGDAAGALVATGGALAVQPLAFLPLLMRAGLLAAMGRDDEAGEAASAAVFHAPPAGALSDRVAAELGRVAAIADAFRRRRRTAFASATGTARADAPAAEVARIDRFVSNTLRETRAYPQAPSHFHFPGLPVVEFWDAAAMPALAAFAAATDAIRAEFLALQADPGHAAEPYIRYDADLPLAQWAALNHSDRWRAFHLWQRGERVEANAARCPHTMAAFEALDVVRVPGRSPNLMFSVLAPGARIPPHTGVANTRVVVHLPLIVPPGCGFRVGAETRAWREGEAFAFDDTIEHEAWNDGAGHRVVLIGDIWRPELSAAERAAVAAVIAATAPVTDGL
jgi:aspartyl/asparaginyl beta-hydroxylase (cupin superfamily)